MVQFFSFFFVMKKFSQQKKMVSIKKREGEKEYLNLELLIFETLTLTIRLQYLQLLLWCNYQSSMYNNFHAQTYFAFSLVFSHLLKNKCFHHSVYISGRIDQLQGVILLFRLHLVHTFYIHTDLPILSKYFSITFLYHIYYIKKVRQYFF